MLLLHQAVQTYCIQALCDLHVCLLTFPIHQHQQQQVLLLHQAGQTYLHTGHLWLLTAHCTSHWTYPQTWTQSPQSQACTACRPQCSPESRLCLLYGMHQPVDKTPMVCVHITLGKTLAIIKAHMACVCVTLMRDLVTIVDTTCWSLHALHCSTVLSSCCEG